MLESCGIVTSLERNLRGNGVDHRLQRIQLSRAPHDASGLFVTAHLGENVAQHAVCHDVAWIESDGPPEGRFRPSAEHRFAWIEGRGWGPEESMPGPATAANG